MAAMGFMVFIVFWFVFALIALGIALAVGSKCMPKRCFLCQGIITEDQPILKQHMTTENGLGTYRYFHQFCHDQVWGGKK